MSIQVERSVDDPIVTYTFKGRLDAETTQEVRAQTAQLLTEMGMFYAIVDLQESEITSAEVLSLLEISEATKLDANRRIRPVFIGRRVPKESASQLDVTVLTSKEEAREYVEKEIAANASNQTSDSLI